MLRHQNVIAGAPFDGVADPDDSGADLETELAVEDWVASTLDTGEKPDTSVAVDGWVIGLRKNSPVTPPKRRTDAGAGGEGWARFRMVRKGSVTVLRLADRNLTKEAEVRELADDLLSLTGAGYTRVVLNFSAVERVSSAVIGAVAEAQRRVVGEGGGLRVCGVSPHVAQAFALISGGRGVAIFTDEATALQTPWPGTPGPDPLPVDVLASLVAEEPIAPAEPEAPTWSPPTTWDLACPAVRLVVVGGWSAGWTIRMPADQDRFILGREGSCDVVLDEGSVNRAHAAVERKGARVVLRDLGSHAGTTLNGRLLRGDSAELGAGDRVEVGGLTFAVLFDAPGVPSAAGVEESVADWLLDEAGPGAAEPTAGSGYGLGPEADPGNESGPVPLLLPGVDPKAPIRCELIEGVAVITPKCSELDGEEVVGPLRAALLAAGEGAGPPHLVVNLECVMRLSGQAVGVLVAQHLRLHRAGGGLRLCQAPVRLMAMLEKIRLPALIECFPTAEDAVLLPWPSSRTPA